MTPRNDMDTAEPQADTFEVTSGHNAFSGEAISTRPGTSTQRSRRHTRIAVSLPIVVRDQFGGREETRTQFVTVRGAVIETSSNVRVGHKLTLQIARTGRAAECHVVGIEPTGKNSHSLEVEFTREQQDFWPVQFPPEDLKTDSGSYRFSTASASSTLGSQPANGPRIQNGKSQVNNHSSNEIVSLADAIPGNSFTGTSGAKPERYTPSSAPIDSVAQFRAANRAAHRREQRKKTLYSMLSFAALAAAFMGVRYWMDHRSEMEQVKLPQVSLPSISQVLPKAKPSKKPIPTSSDEQALAPTLATPPAPAPAEIPHPTPISAASESVASNEMTAPPIAPEVKPAESQVAVRHGATVPTRKAHEDVGEEPIALPLRVDNSTPATKPEVLNEVVAQTPMKAAMLAPQPVRKAVPARLIYSAPAQYPPMARQIRAEGEVVISLDVDTSGKVSSARAVSGPPILRVAALDAVKHWKYQPATLGDIPVVSTEVVKVQFKLR